MNVYGYVRISRDDKGENYETIITQKRLIKDYIKDRFNCDMKKIYEDDNVSGYKFDRSGFEKLEENIKKGEVQVLAVKDLSRIGRNNALTLLFLEFLKENNVRFISISDNYDSFKDEDDVIGIKTWYNERYVKDISKKITGNLKVKQRNGGVIIRPYFGYKINPNDKTRLIIDENVSGVIKRIFKLYVEGNGYRKISDILNSEGILTPSQYKKIQDGNKRPVAKYWTPVHVSRIINDDVYVGTLRCGKTKKKKIKGQSIRVPKEEHIVYEDHHEGIISKEDFKLAQAIAKRRDQRKIRAGSHGINLYSGFLFCGDCGKYMVMRRRKHRSDSYICGTYHGMGSKYCTSHHIKEEDINNILLNNLQEHMECIEVNFEKIQDNIERAKKSKNNYDKIIRNLNKSAINKKEEIKNYARQMARGLVDEQIHNELVWEANQELKIIINQIDEMEKYKRLASKSQEEVLKAMDELKSIVEKGVLTRRDIEVLLDKIIVYQPIKPTRGSKSDIQVHVKWNRFIGTI
ncbi:MAG: recombinase family protein [Anaeromicrobium sp.]|uniref:recombinase family protein n=1 Tax=Anaeromicrobium sp. TaxID=1929132 RepID=UPI0025F39D13|nr:recombinase family protein [Anaeromicrobium sp.]MCT4592922.1 recombinase family protein [Anaeromicrobium sp.]